MHVANINKFYFALPERPVHEIVPFCKSLSHIPITHTIHVWSMYILALGVMRGPQKPKLYFPMSCTLAQE